MYLSIYLPINPSFLSIHLSIHLFFHPSIYLTIYPSIHLSIYLSVCLPVCLSICPPVYLQLENKAILRDFFIFQTRQHQKRSNSARRDFLNFRRWQHQKRYNSARLPSKMEVGCTLTASCQCVLQFFHSTCLKYCAYHEKLMPGHMKCCICHAKSS